MRNRIPCQRDAGTRLATALRRRPFSTCNKGNRRRLHAGNLSCRAVSLNNCPKCRPVDSHCQKRKPVVLSQKRMSCPISSSFILDISTRFLNHFIMAVIFANGECQCQMTFLSLAFFFCCRSSSGGSKVHVWRCQFCWYRFWPIFRAQKNCKIPACRLGKQLSDFVFLGPLLTWTLVHWASELQKLLA